MQPAPAPRGQLWRFFREHVRPYFALQVEIGAVLFLSVVLELADPLILRAIIDRALGDSDHSLLVLLVGLLAGVLVFRVTFRMLSVWLYSYSGLRILFDLRQRAFEHIERLSPYFFRGERFGDILARLTSDIDVLQRAAAHTMVNVVHDLLVIGGILGVLFWLDVPLTLYVLLIYPPLVLTLVFLNRRLRREGTNAREAIGNLYTFLEERIGLMRLVQEFSREKAEARRHVRVSRPWIRSNVVLSLLGSGQISLADLTATGGTILVFLLGGARVLEGTLSLGTLIAFFTLSGRLYRPISGLIDVNIDLQVARASLRRIFSLLDREPDIIEAEDAECPASLAGRMELVGIGHRWPDGSQVLSDIDLEIEPGQVVALVGSSGSGKSTLAALLARNLDPDRGAVRIDGVNLRRWPLRDLRRAVGLVPQETLLFHDSLAANLRLARRHASDNELRDALEAVELGDFVDGLAEGLKTEVGEQGLRLSGGERQRLALARVLLKDPWIYILDEATSALDSETERKVLTAFRERARGKTILLVAHRLTSIRDVDRIFVLEGGRLVEAGTHDELYAAGGRYRRLYDEHLRTPPSPPGPMSPTAGPEGIESTPRERG